VRQQQQEAQERERIEQELRVARLIQQTLLPKAVPEIPGYDVAAFYRPAREVGGDFYDFVELEGGKLGLVVGLFYSDGLVEAHDPRGDMFGFPRLQGFVGAHPGGAKMIDFLLDELARFVGDGWEQEDDITLVTLQRSETS
jgi:serine phosphatase RsbU (regulator of sigma subunit)